MPSHEYRSQGRDCLPYAFRMQILYCTWSRRIGVGHIVEHCRGIAKKKFSLLSPAVASKIYD